MEKDFTYSALFLYWLYKILLLPERLFLLLTRRNSYYGALVEGIFLGLLKAETLQAFSNLSFSEDKRYETETWNTQGFMGFEADAVEQFFPKSGRLLLLSVGCGRELIQLKNFNYEIDAWECNRELVEKGNRLLKRLGINNEIRWYEPFKLPETKGNYDIVYIGWTGFTHIVKENDRNEMLMFAFRSLNPDGIIFLSFWATEAYSPHSTRIFKIASSISKKQNNDVVLGDRLIPPFGHIFTMDTIKHAVEKNGFKIIHSGIAYSGFVVAKKST